MLQKAKKLESHMIAWRREFHMYPELGFREIRTTENIRKILEGMGFRIPQKLTRTGVVAEIGAGHPCIAIRADMDALPIQEQTGMDYESRNPGLMHACGHDVHMACALGAASLVAGENFQGSVRFIFQPSEEVADESGTSGAPYMISAGALEGVDAIIALHVEASTLPGQIRTEEGPASGGVDSWFGEILGKGGHGAYPHESLDPFYITAQVVNSLNAIISRRLSPFAPAVISIGSLHGGSTENVIPDRVKITGTLRYIEKDVQQQLHTEIQRAFEVSRTLGGDYVLKFEIGTPPMVNDGKITKLITDVGCSLLGEKNVLPWRKELGAEDFGCYLDVIPGSMFALGAQIAGSAFGLHSPYFNIDERCLPIGAGILAETALRYLSGDDR